MPDIHSDLPQSFANFTKMPPGIHNCFPWSYFISSIDITSISIVCDEEHFKRVI